MKKLPAFLLLLLCLGCQPKSTTPIIKIALTNNGQSLTIMGLNGSIIKEIARDSINSFQSLVPVYRMPADTDMKDYQPTQPGKYLVKDSTLTFTPDTPFTKQQTYFVRYYQYGGGSSVWDFVKRRKTVKSVRYTDLIFKLK